METYEELDFFGVGNDKRRPFSSQIDQKIFRDNNEKKFTNPNFFEKIQKSNILHKNPKFPLNQFPPQGGFQRDFPPEQSRPSFVNRNSPTGTPGMDDVLSPPYNINSKSERSEIPGPNFPTLGQISENFTSNIKKKFKEETMASESPP